ncbi:hypothetical protein H0H93_003171 [Arthromyces matolae]|nr:hypothetical protein H0H93_003171 [Arthromyces matolae]
MKLFDLEVVIKVDQVALPEFGIQYDETKKQAMCWIPSEAGKVGLKSPMSSATSSDLESDFLSSSKPFAISCQALRPHAFAITTAMSVDGTRITGIIIKPSSCRRHTRNAAITSATTSRALLFSTVQLSDDESLGATHRKLGDIVVDLYQAKMGKRKEYSKAYRKEYVNNDKVSEKSKKAVSHKVAFGEELPCEKNYKRTMVRISKLATFTFKYRSIDVLKADGIAPPDPKPQLQTPKGKRKANDSEVLEIEDSTDDEDSAMYKGLVPNEFWTNGAFLNSQEALEAIKEKRAKKKARKAASNPAASKKIKKEQAALLQPGAIEPSTLLA